MPHKTVYKRRVFRFSSVDVARASSLSRAPELGKTVIEWRDQGTVGLTLRITRDRAVWYIRRKETTLQVGDADIVPLEQARYIAKHVNLAASQKVQRDLKDIVRVILGWGGDLTDAIRGQRPEDQIARWDQAIVQRQEASKLPPAAETPFWTWATLTEKFLAYKKPKLKSDYADEYEGYLRLEHFFSIRDVMVRDITLRDLERVRDAIASTRAKSTVHRALTQTKAMLSWAWKYHASASGLENVQHEWWLRWSFEYKSGSRTHAPTLAEIARTLVIAEKYTDLADGEHETYPGTLGALWGVCLTAQRSGAFLNLRPDRLFDPSKQERGLRGWKIANWTAQEMKGGKDGGRPHSLPIPPDALKIISKFHLKAGGSSKWMFTGRDPSKHITQSALNLAMYRLQGRVWDHTVKRKPNRKGKPGPKPGPKKTRVDLFALYGIERWTLHDIRRTLTTFLDDRRLGGAATAILGHKTPTAKADEREKLATVTEQHYNRSQKIRLKADGMALWVKALISTYERERKKLRIVETKKLAA